MSEFNGDQKCNAAGRQIVESSEQFYEKAYPDSGGIWTIGFGHTSGVTKDMPPCTLNQADTWLAEDLKTAEDAINGSVGYQLSSNQFSALVSLVFNIGTGNWARSSALHLINNGDFEDVPEHIMLWEKDHHGVVQPGLVKRRQKEVALWNTPDPESDSNDDTST